MRRDATKKHCIKSTDRANIYRINFVLICCISFCSQVMNFEKIRGSNTFAIDRRWVFSTTQHKQNRYTHLRSASRWMTTQ